MDDYVIEIIRTVIEVDEPKDAPPSRAWIELDRLDDEAFNFVLWHLSSGKLVERQQVNALRALARLTRHACQHRREELLEVALEYTRSDATVVRSTAVNMAIWLTAILEGAPHKVLRPENAPHAHLSSRRRVAREVEDAFKRGLDSEQSEFAAALLATVT
jgi:hypothetical protein